MTWTSDARKVVTTIMGLAIAGISGYAGWVIVNAKPIDRHLVYFAGGGVFLGALLVAPSTLMTAAKQLLSLLPSIKIGGGSPPSP